MPVMVISWSNFWQHWNCQTVTFDSLRIIK